MSNNPTPEAAPERSRMDLTDYIELYGDMKGSCEVYDINLMDIMPLVVEELKARDAAQTPTPDAKLRVAVEALIFAKEAFDAIEKWVRQDLPAKEADQKMNYARNRIAQALPTLTENMGGV